MKSSGIEKVVFVSKFYSSYCVCIVHNNGYIEERFLDEESYLKLKQEAGVDEKAPITDERVLNYLRGI